MVWSITSMTVAMGDANGSTASDARRSDPVPTPQPIDQMTTDADPIDGVTIVRPSGLKDMSLTTSCSSWEPRTGA